MKLNCLLHSLTLGSFLKPALCRQSYMKPFLKEHFVPAIEMDKCVKTELCGQGWVSMSMETCFLSLKWIENVLRSQLSQFQLLVLQFITANFLVRMAFNLENQISNIKNKTEVDHNSLVIAIQAEN